MCIGISPNQTMLGRSSPTALHFGQTECGRQVGVGLGRRCRTSCSGPRRRGRACGSRSSIPPCSCSGSMFWVTIVTSPPYPGSRRASASMGGVGHDVGGAEHAARLVVEIEHLLLVAVPGLDRGDVLEVDAGPQPVRVAERVDAAFLGDARPGQHDDAGRTEIPDAWAKSSAVLGWRTMAIEVLFVCTANICRSPMAEGVFRTLARRAGLVDAFDDRLGRDVGRPCRQRRRRAGDRGRRRRGYDIRRSSRAARDQRGPRQLRLSAGDGQQPSRGDALDGAARLSGKPTLFMKFAPRWASTKWRIRSADRRRLRGRART